MTPNEKAHITLIKLMGADGKITTISVLGIIDEPYELIQNSQFSDHKVVWFEAINLGKIYNQDLTTGLTLTSLR